MTTYENRNVVGRAWRYDRIIGKTHGGRGYEFIREISVQEIRYCREKKRETAGWDEVLG